MKVIAHTLQDPKLYQYIIVGGLSACVDLSIFLALNRILPYHFLVPATISFVFATLFNYLLCNFFLFAHEHKHSQHMKLFLVYLVSGIGLIIHHSVLLFAVQWLLWPMLIAKLFAMGSAFGWNFLSRKHLVFA